MIHPIPNGLFCVPSAICALTGADAASVVIPAINRVDRAASLLEPPAGVAVTTARAVLAELGYVTRRYKQADLRARLSTWATRSAQRYPGRTLLVTTSGRPGHALVLEDGRIYDNHLPAGAAPTAHPFSHHLVDEVLLVEKR